MCHNSVQRQLVRLFVGVLAVRKYCAASIPERFFYMVLDWVGNYGRIVPRQCTYETISAFLMWVKCSNSFLWCDVTCYSGLQILKRALTFVEISIEVAQLRQLQRSFEDRIHFVLFWKSWMSLSQFDSVSFLKSWLAVPLDKSTFKYYHRLCSFYIKKELSSGWKQMRWKLPTRPGWRSGGFLVFVTFCGLLSHCLHPVKVLPLEFCRTCSRIECVCVKICTNVRDVCDW